MARALVERLFVDRFDGIVAQVDTLQSVVTAGEENLGHRFDLVVVKERCFQLTVVSKGVGTQSSLNGMVLKKNGENTSYHSCLLGYAIRVHVN